MAHEGVFVVKETQLINSRQWAGQGVSKTNCRGKQHQMLKSTSFAPLSIRG